MSDVRVALVTGGGSGIGKASAIALSRSGRHVVIADRNLEAARTVAHDLADAGNRALGLHVDVADSASVDAMVDRTKEAYGRLDVLVHCAGIASAKPVLELSDEEWRTVLGVNLDGTFFVTQIGRAHV